MKTFAAIRTTLILFSLGIIIFYLNIASKPAGVIDHHKVGDVIYSILTPTQFNQVHGAGWVLMDGQVIDQQYDLRRVFGWTNVPDARGVFIRGVNGGRDKATGDPDSDNLNNRTVASYQGDLFKTHSHLLANNNVGNRQNANVYLSLMAIVNTSIIGHTNHEYQLNGTATEPTLFKTGSAGDTETRPRNIALYTYIKIHEQ